MIRLILFSVCICLLSLTGCGSHENDQKKNIEKPPVIHDSVLVDTLKKPSLREHSYYIINKKKTEEWKLDSFSQGELNVILALNRIDYADIWRVDSLIAPKNFFDELINYSPFPEKIQSILPVRKLLLVSYKIQAFAAYENGTLVRWGPVSLGKKSTPTPVGLFHTNWKSKETISTIDSGWVLKWYFNFENFQGISLHEYELPGYPASHACIRLYPDDAFFIYNWAEQWILKNNSEISANGTPLIIFGDYAYGKRKPWLFLENDPHILDFSEEELNGVIEAYLQLILDRQAQRDSVSAPL